MESADTRFADAIRASLERSAEVIRSLGAQADRIHVIAGLLVRVLQAGGRVLTAGNGGSAAEALHMAEELSGRYRRNRRPLPGLCLNADPTVLTCIANDFGFEEVFSRQVRAFGRPGDVLVLFSTSGNSVNLRRALETARTAGVQSVSLLGKGGGSMGGRSDLELIVAANETERIQEAHQVILHLLLDRIDAAFPDEA